MRRAVKPTGHRSVTCAAVYMYRTEIKGQELLYSGPYLWFCMHIRI